MRVQIEHNDSNAHIRSEATEIGQIDGYEFWVAPAPLENGLNGYIVFPKRPVRETFYEGILTYVPVHGGITYAEESDLGMVYGFDTAHCDSNEYPRSCKAWIREEIEAMLNGILKAAEVERNYLRCKTNKGKAKHAQAVMDTRTDKEIPYNFGTVLNLLSGSL